MSDVNNSAEYRGDSAQADIAALQHMPCDELIDITLGLIQTDLDETSLADRLGTAIGGYLTDKPEELERYLGAVTGNADPRVRSFGFDLLRNQCLADNQELWSRWLADSDPTLAASGRAALRETLNGSDQLPLADAIKLIRHMAAVVIEEPRK